MGGSITGHGRAVEAGATAHRAELHGVPEGAGWTARLQVEAAQVTSCLVTTGLKNSHFSQCHTIALKLALGLVA